MPMTIQQIDAAFRDRILAARQPLIDALTRAAAGKPWHYILFGSLARGTARCGSDADIAIVDAAEAWLQAESAALDACEALGLDGDVTVWEDLSDRVRSEVLRDGIRCG